MKALKVLLVDDNPLITSGLALILKTDSEISEIETVDNALDAISYCRTHDVDIVLMDIRMPGMNGIEATKVITEETLAKVIILTTFDEDDYIVAGIKNGASAYLLKNTPPAVMIDSIKAVFLDQHVLSSSIWTKTRQMIDKPGEPGDLSDLTDREQEITALVAQGLSNGAIAKRLFLSEGTIHNHISTILHKLNLDHRTQLAIYYLTGKVGEEN